MSTGYERIMKLCPYCSGQMDNASVVCQHCGRDWKSGVSPLPIDNPRSSRSQSRGVIVFATFILFLAYLIVNLVLIQRVMH